MHSDRGQGTVEYLAVVLLVTVALGRLGHDRVLVRERRSDGSETVTLTTAPSLGLQTVKGAGARIDRGRRGFSLGGGLTASVIAALGHGETWVLPNRETADALVAALERDADVRPPDQEIGKVEVAAGLKGSRSAPRTGSEATGSLTAGLQGGVGRITDKRTGGHTDFLEGGADAVLDLSARLSGLRAAASARGTGSARIALTVDGEGRRGGLAPPRTGGVSGTAAP